MNEKWERAWRAAATLASPIWITTASWKSSFPSRIPTFMSSIRRADPKWTFQGHFWYHSSPSIADLQHTGELNIVFTSPGRRRHLRAPQRLQSSAWARTVANGSGNSGAHQLRTVVIGGAHRLNFATNRRSQPVIRTKYSLCSLSCPCLVPAVIGPELRRARPRTTTAFYRPRK